MNSPPEPPPRKSDVCAVVFALVFPTVVTWVYFVWLKEADPSLQKTAYGIGKALQFAFPVVWVLAVQRERLRIQWPSLRGVPTGLGFGAVIFAATVVLYHAWMGPAGLFEAAGAEIYQKVRGFSVDSFWPYFALGAFYSIGHSFLEEYYWRWFVFGQLRRLMPLSGAILVSSVGFMAHHVLVLGTYFGYSSPATWLFSAAVAVGGAVWAWLYHRSGSLYSVWLSHLLVDAAIFTVGYDLVRPYFTG